MGVIFCGCCFSGFSAKTNEIILIIANFVSLFLLFLCFRTIQWNDISNINLILFIAMLALVLICTIFIIILRIWRGQNVIKTTKKKAAIKIVNADFYFTLICLILCVVEEICILISFAKAIKGCEDKKDESYGSGGLFLRRVASLLSQKSSLENDLLCEEKRKKANREYYISYVTLSYMELILFFSLCALSVLKKRVFDGTDIDVRTIPRGGMVVIPMQGMGMGMGMEMPNNYDLYSNNMNYGLQNMNFGSSNMAFGSPNMNCGSPNLNFDSKNMNIDGQNSSKFSQSPKIHQKPKKKVSKKTKKQNNSDDKQQNKKIISDSSSNVE